MGSRGPKPKSLQEHSARKESLRTAARTWAYLLYGLRDGAPGYAQKVEFESAGDGRILTAKMRTKTIRFLPSDSYAEQGIEKLLRTDDWIVCPPSKPEPKLWEQFRDAETLTEHQRAARKIQRWWNARQRKINPVSTPPVRSPAFTTSTAQFQLLASRDLLDAKKSSLYPQTPEEDRPTNDNKRVQFFAKAMAGLLHSIAPATAMRHWLSRERFPNDFVEKYEQLFGQRQTKLGEFRPRVA